MGKYPSLGILETFFGIPDHPGKYEFYTRSRPKTISREELWKMAQKRLPGITRSVFIKRLHSLKTNGFVEATPSGAWRITRKTQERFFIESLVDVVLKNKKTDEYKRLIIFDIPERRRDVRDVLRRKLKEFECRALQRSVYITPYVCENEIHEIARILNAEQYIHVLRVVP